MRKNVLSKTENLYSQTKPSPVMTYLRMKQAGKNVPLSWLKRYEKSRRELNNEVGRVFQNKMELDSTVLAQWEIAYEKECFYQALRCLYELDIQGKTEL
jgi:hypothetical protein